MQSLSLCRGPYTEKHLRFSPDFFLIWPRSRYCPLRRLAAAAARPSLRLGRPCRPWLPCYQLTRVEALPIPHLLVKLVLAQREPLLTRLLVELGVGLPRPQHGAGGKAASYEAIFSWLGLGLGLGLVRGDLLLLLLDVRLRDRVLLCAAAPRPAPLSLRVEPSADEGWFIVLRRAW